MSRLSLRLALSLAVLAGSYADAPSHEAAVAGHAAEKPTADVAAAASTPLPGAGAPHSKLGLSKGAGRFPHPNEAPKEAEKSVKDVHGISEPAAFRCARVMRLIALVPTMIAILLMLIYVVSSAVTMAFRLLCTDHLLGRALSAACQEAVTSGCHVSSTVLRNP